MKVDTEESSLSMLGKKNFKQNFTIPNDKVES